MKFGWPISIFLHLSLALGGLFMFRGALQTETTSIIVPVEMLTIDDLNNIKAAVRKPKDNVPETEDPMALETPMEFSEEEGEAQPVEKAAEVTTPVSDMSDNSDEGEEIIEDKPEEKPSFNLDDMAALIDRTRETQPEKNQQQTLQSERNTYLFAEMARSGVGEQNAMTANELSALQSAMYKCWRIPLDAKNPEELGVRVRVRLQRDGTVRRVDLLDKALVERSSNPFMKIAAQRAVSAVSKCAPYDFLPVEKYSQWQDMTLNFVPET